MELSTLLFSVAFVWGIAVVTPGPNFFITAHTAMGRSRRSAIFIVLGISSGTIIWALSGFFGINLLFKTIPWIYSSLKLLGGAYLVYLGIKLAASKSRESSEGIAVCRMDMKVLQSYKLGLFTSLSNPKTAAFITSLFAATIPSETSYEIGIWSAALMALISIVWYSFVAYIFSTSQFRYLYRNIRVWIERVAGVIFIGFGVRLAAGE